MEATMTLAELTPEELREQKARSSRLLLNFGIGAIVMGFIALGSAVFVSKSSGFWVQFPIPSAFTISTILIVVSSIILHAGYVAIRKDNKQVLRLSLLATFVLGIAFTVLQWQGWGQLVDAGIYWTGPDFMTTMSAKGTYGEDFLVLYNDVPLVERNGEFFLASDELFRNSLNSRLVSAGNTAASYWYMLVGLHMLHLFGGLIALIVGIVFAFKGSYHKGNTNGVRQVAVYWHFLGLLWLTLFFFFQFIH